MLFWGAGYNFLLFQCLICGIFGTRREMTREAIIATELMFINI
jgi:hypothetical protein